jgi:hypothetical protein
MPIPASGQIALAGTIGVELGRSATQQISLSESTVAALAGLSIGAQVSFSTFYGKSSQVTINLTIAANTANYNMRTAAIAAGWNGSAAATINCTINNGVYVYSTTTGAYAFDTGTGYPASGVTLNLTNNGIILGDGGDGGRISYTTTQFGLNNAIIGRQAPTAGGPAFYAQRAINVTNNGTISGGGGGGGGGGVYGTYL